MATRSGKRIHKSIETVEVGDTNIAEKGERKTRGRRAKDKSEDVPVSVSKSKKNYVSYPAVSSDEEKQEERAKPARPLRKHTLHEINVEPEQNANQEDVDKHSGRQTRRTKRFIDEEQESCPDPEFEIKKGKKSKKKKGDVVDEKENTESASVPLKKNNKKKKKKGKKVSNDVKEVNRTASLNNSNASADSFHSAAGSPLKNSHTDKAHNGTLEKLNTLDKLSKLSNGKSPRLNKSVEVLSQNKRKSVASPRQSANKETVELNTTFDKDDVPKDSSLNTSHEKKTRSHNKSITLEVSEDTTDHSTNTKPLDTTFDKDSQNDILNSTFDKDSQNDIINSTFDKDNNDEKKSSEKPDDIINLTFDKSDSMTRISITSDDSKISENILNTTPVLIESSIDSSQTPETLDTSRTTRSSNQKKETPVTPLKREGTFTKDELENAASPPKTKSNVNTPTKTRMSMPSPGRTPYHSNSKPSNKKKVSMLNRTHSVEKPSRLSLADRTRNTRVMFCSPVNNPVMNTQRKSKIIKSSMKGSNKSFVFEESIIESSASEMGSGRKRARGEAGEAGEGDTSRAKRTRLAEDLQLSVQRLSRPRTSSHNPTPSKKTVVTPGPKSEGKPARSKLPNFAALHQRRFDKMESLGESQLRKAKRAKQLLVPSGGITVLERSSPKAVEQPKSAVKQPEPSKPQTPTKASKVEQKPGYTKFGFKINMDVNPFSITSKNADTKSSEVKEPRPNGQLKRQTTAIRNLKKPTVTLNNTTIPRKEAAKSIILREKSTTALRELRDNKRNETRTIIKGVRTNRRFELQMKSRNINGV